MLIFIIRVRVRVRVILDNMRYIYKNKQYSYK